MSDYGTTHADYDKHHRDRDFAEWFDSLPNPEPITPTCGQCKFFEITRAHLDEPNEGICRLRTYLEIHDNGALTLCEKRGAFDDICDRYLEECPF
jgi:hypothetical protein